jgi:putative ABC transport system substrate-binding protein
MSPTTCARRAPGRAAGLPIAGLALLVVALAVLGAPPAPAAQGTAGGKPVRIARLSPLSAEADVQNLAAFRKGMRDLGWIEGRTFLLETRFADGRLDRLPALAADLVRQRVDLILTGSSPGALAAKQATATIPIVMVTTGDPVAEGIVSSLARPGGNVTGVTAIGQALNTKRLQLLKDAVPGLTRVGVLLNPVSLYTPGFLKEKDAAAQALGLDVRLLEAREPTHLDTALSRVAADSVGALLVQTNPMFLAQRQRLVDAVARSRVPTVYGERAFVEAGGLMFYGASLAVMYRDAAGYADRILKGTRPADLPVVQPTRLELVINLKTARALGLTIPPRLLSQADHVIQ